jgi:hypothetical protein
VGTVRRDCLGWLLITGQRHPEPVPREYAAHHDAARPAQALGLVAPLARGHRVRPAGAVVRRGRLGGLAHEHERRAA